MTREDILRDPEMAPYVRRHFFERLFSGLMDRPEALAEARRLDMDLQAGGYAIALFTLPLPPRTAADYLTDPAAEARSGLLAYFLKYSEYVTVPWGADACAALIKGEAEQMPGLIRRCVDQVEEQFVRRGLDRWYVAVSGPAARLEDLPGCWEEVSRLWAWRYVQPDRHIFLPGAAEPSPAPEETGAAHPSEPAGGSPPAAETGGALGRALAYMGQTIADPGLSLAGAAAHAGVTAGYLSALFRRELGVTFTEHVTARRMALARDLLADTDVPVGQAARQAGFRDARYFSTLFKKTQGCTPTEYREAQRKKS